MTDNPHDVRYPTAAERGDDLFCRLARMQEMRLRVGIHLVRSHAS